MEQDRFVSYAQNLEDVMLWRALRGALDGPGFYIDVGASDPTALSVTRAFYERGWRGLNVEPLPDVVALLRAARPRDVTVEVAVAADAGTRVFHRVVQYEQTGLSTLDAAEAARHAGAGAAVETFDVEVETLAALCRAHVTGDVHFLKVDAEGAEAEVLAGADFRVVRPWVVVVEATHPGSVEGSEAAWEPGLLAAGYRPVWFDGLNRFYLAEERGELARHFTVPPNVFDAYVQYDPVLEAHVASTQTLADERGVVIGRLEAEVARLVAEAEVEPRGEPEAEEVAAPDPAPVAPRVVAPGVVAIPEVSMVEAVAPRGLGRRLVGRAYRLVRPVVRPVIWRVRSFLMDELVRQMIDMRAKQDLVLGRLELLEHHVRSSSGGQTVGITAGQADVLGRVLLTLALAAEAQEPKA